MAASARWRAAMRRRELAASDRVGRYARGQVRARLVATLRRGWMPLVGMLVLLLLAFVPWAWTEDGGRRWFVIGVGLSTAVWVDVLVVLFLSGAMGALDGLAGEQWTADELRRLQRRGWRIVNGLVLKEGSDIDHVAVGPAGVFVVETKHSAHPWPLDGDGAPFMAERLEGARRQALDNARIVGLMTPIRTLLGRVPVRAVVVVHSSSFEPVDGPPWREEGAVTVVRGTHLREWLKTIDAERLSEEAAAGIWTAIEEHAGRRDAWVEQHSGPTPLTSGQLLRRVVVGVPIGLLAGSYLTFAVTAWLGWWGLALVVPIAVAFGLWARGFRSLRWAADAWVVGVAGASLAVAAIVVVAWLS